MQAFAVITALMLCAQGALIPTDPACPNDGVCPQVADGDETSLLQTISKVVKESQVDLRGGDLAAAADVGKSHQAHLDLAGSDSAKGNHIKIEQDHKQSGVKAATETHDDLGARDIAETHEARRAIAHSDSAISYAQQKQTERDSLRESGATAQGKTDTDHTSRSMSEKVKDSSEIQRRAIHNYEKFHGYKVGSVNLGRVQKSAAGIEGWSRFHEIQQKSNSTQVTSPQFVEPEQLAMVKLAYDAYGYDPKSDSLSWNDAFTLYDYGWIRDEIYSVESDTGLDTDYVAVYRNTDAANPVCVVSFAGSNNLMDFFSNTNIFTKDYCNADKRFHSGFVNELENLRGMKSPGFGDLEERLNADDCVNNIWVTGHSLGGAMAEIFAYCVNNDPTYYKTQRIPAISKVYTFGAPAPSKDQLTNTGNTCFDGDRFFNEDSTWCDYAVPFFNAAGFVHPKLESQRLKESGSPNVNECSSNGAKKYPNGWYLPSYSMHSITEYESRIENAFGKAIPIGQLEAMIAQIQAQMQALLKKLANPFR